MSLESVIAEQTAAIQANTAALQALLAIWTAKPAAHLTSDVIKAACAPLKTKAAKPAAVTPPAAVEPINVVVVDTPAPAFVTPEPVAAVVEAVAPATVAAIEYPQIMKAITDVVKVDRARAVAALEKFGAKKGTELKVEDYAAFLAALGGAL